MSEFDNRSGGNPFAPPVAKVEDAAPVSGEAAGRDTRLVAAIIDTIVYFAVAYAVGLATGRSIYAEEDGSLAFMLANSLALAAFAAVQALPLHRRGQSLGKMAVGIRIVRTDGSRASLVRLVGLRLVPFWAINMVPFVGWLVSLVDCLLIFRDSRRCLHDDIADTVVVRA